MAGSSNSEEKTISDLPPEILSHIFSYLPGIRKVVRLVCSEWNESCNVEEVSGRERMTIRSDEMEFLKCKKFQRNIYNLYLDGVTFTTRNVSFFKRFGGKLRSLKLQDCGADGYVPFLRFCKNLHILKLTCCFPTIIKAFRRSNGSPVQTNIVSLELRGCYMWTDKIMDATFRMCPKLRSLTLKDVPLQPSPSVGQRYSVKNGERFYHRSDVFTFDCVFHAISVRAADLVELNLKSMGGIPPELFENIASIPNLKLRKLMIDNPSITPKNLCDIVTQQPNLQNLTVHSCEGLHLDGSANWIEKCSQLTRLEIETAGWDPEPAMFDERFLNTVKSRPNLRELLLKLGCSSTIRVPSNWENRRTAFDQLRTLDLTLLFIDYDSVLEKVSENLQHLRLYYYGFKANRPGVEITSKTLEFVSNRFTNLETLSFTFDGEPKEPSSTEDFSAERLSFGNLEKLKTLRVSVPELHGYSTRLLERFKAPNVASLELLGFDEIDAISLRELVKNFPLVECLYLVWTEFVMDPLDVRIMSDWKRLNFLYHGGHEYLELHRLGGDENRFDPFLKSGAFDREKRLFPFF